MSRSGLPRSRARSRESRGYGIPPAALRGREDVPLGVLADAGILGHGRASRALAHGTTLRSVVGLVPQSPALGEPCTHRSWCGNAGSLGK